MPNQLFVYYIGNLLMLMLTVGIGGVMVIRLDIDIWEIGEGGTKMGGRKRGGWVWEEV
jgi:hypothetical protein